MKKLKIALAAVALLAAGTLSAQDLSALNAKFTEAAAAVKAKNFAAAVPLFQQVIADGIDTEGAEAIVAGAKQALPQTIFRMGGAAIQAGEHDEALAAFTLAAELAELYGNVAVLNNARNWVSRTVMMQGASAFNDKDYATAAAIFQKGYDANPNDTALGMNLAMSYSGLKEFDKSAPIYIHIIELAAGDSRFAEDGVKARENYSLDVLEKASESAKAGDFNAAIAATDELLAVMPEDAPAQLTRLQAYNSLKNYAKVTELGEAAATAQTTPEDASDVWYLVGAAYQNMQNLPQAIAAYGKVTAGDNVAAAKAQITELQKVTK
jgi:tetratricopeptide (TPR) repeat protein